MAELGALEAWARENHVPFDKAKYEYALFTGRGKDPLVAGPDLLVGRVHTLYNPQLKWLGVYLDHKLTFVAHCKVAAWKGARAVGLLRRIRGCAKGLPPDLAVRSVNTAVLPRMLYGSEAWWSGPEGFGQAGGVERLDGVLRRALRAALPVWCTTPTPVLHAKSGVPPVSILLEEKRRGYARRVLNILAGEN